MSNAYPDRILALGGVFQAAALVDQVARRGLIPQAEFETCIGSLFEMNPASTEAVYGSRHEIRLGLNALAEQLGNQQDTRNLYMTRYALGLLLLERKLNAQPQKLAYIGKELEAASQQVKHFGLTHSNVIARLADVYSHTISELKPRIMVSGENNHLHNQENVNKVRALLLAGMRSAVLWRQCGGRRWQLLFQRRRTLAMAQELLRA
ncbi:MAG: high frequency lysogenization protein HflD [Chromatiales bacterium]|nr:high frequency lysogenization protein HflD [Gammaproteobacteria bacterium]MBW6477030.1 high frequency lysogenization protein HflD [Chromatiales bacterium]